MKKWKVTIKDITNFHGGVVPVMSRMTETVEANSRKEAKDKIESGKVHMLYTNPKYKIVSVSPIKEK